MEAVSQPVTEERSAAMDPAVALMVVAPVAVFMVVAVDRAGGKRDWLHSGKGLPEYFAFERVCITGRIKSGIANIRRCSVYRIGSWSSRAWREERCLQELPAGAVWPAGRGLSVYCCCWPPPRRTAGREATKIRKAFRIPRWQCSHRAVHVRIFHARLHRINSA